MREDLWMRASVWRLGRIIDGGLIGTTPDEACDPASCGTLLYCSDIDSGAVEVRTPYQVTRAVDAAPLALAQGNPGDRQAS